MARRGVLKSALPLDLTADSNADNGKLKAPVIPWRTNVSAVPPPHEISCFDATFVAAIGLPMDEVGLPWSPVRHDMALPFNGMNRCLKLSNGPGKFLELSRKGLRGLRVRDAFLLKHGESLT